ncbi:MAG: site-specific integrase [Candidatus Zixiibacteriota bacterium]|nr:MAG: site-specific integrase [candidate division Zixibacteria bacterium]
MANIENEKIKRRYFKWLLGAKGYSEKTIVAIEGAIHQFEEFTGYKKFKTFSERQATGFKKWLGEKKNKGHSLSNTTKYYHLRHLNSFFSWLATQSGYKSRISLDAVSYLSLDKRAVHDALSTRPKKYPSKEQVKELVSSISINNDIDRRDQALIAFMFLTGIRYHALCSLSLGCIDLEKLVVNQDPRLGVHTKGGKVITTLILRFDEELVEILKEWINYLIKKLKFGPSDPLFPKTQVSQADEGYSFEANGISQGFWSNSNSIRNILKLRTTNAGLPYFNPHSFRHAACQLALKLCRTPEELKALSQNFGHESVTTTLKSYGTLDDSRVSDVINNIDFSKKKNVDSKQISIADLEEFVNSKKT